MTAGAFADHNRAAKARGGGILRARAINPGSSMGCLSSLRRTPSTVSVRKPMVGKV
jgi:hypothetical protein